MIFYKDFFLSIRHYKGGKDSKDCLKIIINQYFKFFKKHKIFYDVLIENKKGLLIKNILIKFKVKKNFNFILNENGINKLIRCSPFKKKKKIQTSYCSIMFYPLIKNQKMKLKKSDIIYFYSRSSKPGGQNVNKTNSSVKIKHIKTGILVKCEKERSQSINKKIALKILKYKINKFYLKKNNNNFLKKKINRIYYFNKSLIINHNPKMKTKNINLVLDGNIEIFYKKYFLQKL
ncbi:peptide chain release factor-like protein [Candidatus Vidania fulgoroideorum]